MAITVLNMTLSAGYCCPGTHWRPLRRRVLGAHECPTWLGTPERKLDWFTGNFTRNPHINEKKQSGWWFQPRWKIWKPLGMMKFPTEWKNNIHVPNHQPDGKKTWFQVSIFPSIQWWTEKNVSVSPELRDFWHWKRGGTMEDWPASYGFSCGDDYNLKKCLVWKWEIVPIYQIVVLIP